MTRRLQIDATERRYELHLPPDLDMSRQSPLILAFHGATSTPEQFAYISQLNRRGGGMGYVIAYPAADGDFWDPSSSENNKDVALVRAMLQDITREVPIDPSRIYATGMSNGGQMVYRLACELSDRIAAIAVSACGMSGGECRPRRTVSVLHFHGTEDGLVPLIWGKNAVDRWIEFNHCEGDPVETYKNGAATCLTYSSRSTGTHVTLCTIDGMGHQYPGMAIRLTEPETRLLGLPVILSRLGPGSDDLDATGMLLSFFSSHPIQLLAEGENLKT